MRQFQALARKKQLLGAAAAIIFGAIILASAFLSGPNVASSGAEVATLADEPAAAIDELASEAETPEAESRPSSTPIAAFAIVYISGAVQQPDVYQVPAAARVKDVVLAAGGLTEDAAIDEINLAEHVTDAQHIHIRRQGESPPGAASTGEDAAGESDDGPLNINTASVADLDGLPGVGQSIAERIIEFRTTNGPFQSVEDLQKVKGIGPSLFAKLAPLVTVGP
jgi:competence protein ComEA